MKVSETIPETAVPDVKKCDVKNEDEETAVPGVNKSDVKNEGE